MKKETNKKEESQKNNGFAIGIAAAASAFAGYYLFGPRGKENRAKIKGWTLKAKGEILEKMEKLEEVTENKYEEIVDVVMSKYEKLKSTTEEETQKLKKELKSRYKHVKRDIKKIEKETGKKVTKARKQVAKKITPKK